MSVTIYETEGENRFFSYETKNNLPQGDWYLADPTLPEELIQEISRIYSTPPVDHLLLNPNGNLIVSIE